MRDNNLQRDGQHKAIILLSSARWSAYGNYIIIFSAMVSIRQLYYYLQRDGQHKAIIGASLSEPHIDHDNVPRRGEIYVCGRV